jgi:hypothetical protein
MMYSELKGQKEAASIILLLRRKEEHYKNIKILFLGRQSLFRGFSPFAWCLA